MLSALPSISETGGLHFFYLLKYVEYFLVATITATPRLYAPFDYDVKGGGEPATLGGYLMIMYMLFMLTPFILTISRASYVALSVSVMTALVMSTRRRFVLFLALAFDVVLFPVLTPRLYNSAKERLMETFQNPYQTVSLGGRQIGLESSAYSALQSAVFVVLHEFLCK